VVLLGYAVVLGVHLLAGLVVSTALRKAAAVPGIPLAAMAAVYTAYLFAQARARDLWQSPLLAPHLMVQAVLSGSAALLPLAAWLAPQAVVPLAWILAASAALHLLLVWAEAARGHPTAHARLAVWEMTRGRFRAAFWAGALLVAVGLLGPALGGAAPWVAPFVLAGLLSYEHAFVQAAQAVPLA
jgi:Ni/Fe-hydrogenase subunit HybB-like protein